MVSSALRILGLIGGGALVTNVRRQHKDKEAFLYRPLILALRAGAIRASARDKHTVRTATMMPIMTTMHPVHTATMPSTTPMHSVHTTMMPSTTTMHVEVAEMEMDVTSAMKTKIATIATMKILVATATMRTATAMMADLQ